jgi:hypothetical protein
MGEKFIIRKIMQTGGIIAHAIVEAGNEVVAWDVLMMALMEGLGSEEVGGSAGRGSRAFALPKQSGGVVRLGEDCAFSDVETLGRRLVVEEATSEFEIAVGDGAVWVAPTDEVGSDGRVKGDAPDNGMGRRRLAWTWCSVGSIVERAQSRSGRSSGQPYAACTFAGGVVTTEERGGQGDELVKARWSTSQVRMEQSEIVEGVVDAVFESEAAFGVLVAQSFLHVTEETSGARDGKRHGS